MDDNNNSDHDVVEDHNGIRIYLSSLMDRVDEETLNGIRNIFQQNNNGRLNESQLKAVLESNGVVLSNNDFKPMFCKIDVRKESTVNFLQFVVYLAYELRIKNGLHEFNEEKQSKFTPKLLPCKSIKDGNRNDVKGIAFRPSTDKTSHTIQDDGEYVTISSNGEIAFYTMDFEWKNTYQIMDSTRWSLTASRLTGLMVLPNFDVVCVATLSGELRFYNATAEEFKLCLTVEQMPSTTTCLAYYASSDPGARSKIAVGNVTGGVTVLEFVSAVADDENPFRGSSVGDTRPPSYVFHDIVAGWPCATAATERPPAPFRAVQWEQLHPASVNQAEFCDSGRSFVSVSGDSRKSMACCRVGTAAAVRYVPAADGFWCVCAIGDARVATGGVDGSVRLWDVFADGRSAGCTELAGHENAVRHVFHGRAPDGHLYSVSADRAIKVWDVLAAACLYTFVGAAQVTDASDCRRWFPALFNQLDQVIAMVVGAVIVPVTCGKDTTRARLLVASDSHDTAVTKTMYNRLFHVLISVSGADSVIAVWNVSTGELITRRAMAHTRQLYGQTLPVEITAASFDPSGGLLVTGAVNGTVHLWDPNNGTCLNRLQIPSKSRISEVIWLPNKILVVGWDRRVTQFDDPLVKCNHKLWLSSHKDVVLSACVQPPVLLVTTSRAGEIGFWRLGTGKLIKRHTVRMKRDRLKTLMTSVPISDSSHMSRGSELLDSRTVDTDSTKPNDNTAKTFGLDLRHEYSAVFSHFLRARPDAPTVGSLFVAMRNGVVQLWCTHKVFDYVARFVAIHVDDDYVTAMASDSRSEYLITSSYCGYVKTWYIADFGVGQPRHVVHDTSSAVMLSLRLRFPFLSGSFPEHAPAKNPTGPLLVNSYRAHLQCVRHVEFVDRLELVVTSGTDKSVRVWTLAGRYVGTLGSPWPKISNDSVVDVTKVVVPTDIEREGSFTTMRVLRSDVTSDFQTPDALGTTEISRRRRETERKQFKRKLQGTKCQKQPLYDIYNELTELATTESSTTDTKPMEIDTEESMTRIKSSVGISLLRLDNIPKKNQLRGITQRKSTKKRTRFVYNI